MPVWELRAPVFDNPEGESEPFDDDFSQKKYARYPKMLYGVKMDTSSF